MSLEKNLIDNLSSDPQTELQVIHYVLLNENGIGLFPRLKYLHFSVEIYSGYWKGIQAIAGNGSVINALSLKSWLKQNGLPYNATDLLSQEMPGDYKTKGNATSIEEYIIGLWKKRETKKLGAAMQSGLIEIDEAQLSINDILTDSKESRIESAEDISGRVMDTFERNWNAKINGLELPDAMPIGIPEVDEKLGGFRTGDLVILAGRPGMGKSTVSRLSIMEIAKNKDCLLLTHEMTKEQVISLIGSSFANIDSQRIRRADLSVDEYGQFQNGVVRAAALNLHVDYITELASLVAGIRAWRMGTDRTKPAAVYIDYGQQIPVNIKGITRNEAVGKVTRTLKEIAKTLDITIFCLAQLNRGVENRGGDRRPQLSDLRDSGEIEQDADAVIFLYRPEYYDFAETESGQSTANMVEAIIEKNRNGTTGTAEFYLDLSTGNRIEYNPPF